MDYYSAIKTNTFESVLMRWMKLEPIIQSEVSQKEKHQYSILTHIYGIQKDGNNNRVYETAKETLLFFLSFIFIGVQPINNVMQVSSRQQRDSAIPISVFILPRTVLPFRLPRNTEQQSMWQRSISLSVWPNYISLQFADMDNLLLTAVAIDHNAAICHPLHYTLLMTPCRCGLLVGGSWGVAHSDSLTQILLLTYHSILIQRCLIFCVILNLS